MDSDHNFFGIESLLSYPGLDFIDDKDVSVPVKLPIVFAESTDAQKAVLLAPQNRDIVEASSKFNSILCSCTKIIDKNIKDYAEWRSTIEHQTNERGAQIDSDHTKCIPPNAVQQVHNCYGQPSFKFSDSFRSDRNYKTLESTDEEVGVGNMDFLDQTSQSSRRSSLGEYKCSFSFISTKGPNRKRRLIHCGYENCTKIF
ncbi:unnamed protein product [Moneuplotes crassus]|uniref:Uncharacterized protein n=1 Tax=Euplotes crassus TaxID=5936 RepID=A0AAD2D2Z5_EUPCR|nr:unnamed protein product [Moneuplotes crassus]